MKMNLKILTAGALIIMACGVVGYNVQFLSDRWEGTTEAEDEAGWEEESEAAAETEERSIPFVPQGGIEAREDDQPLGEEWDNSLWRKLLDDYANRDAAAAADPVAEKESLTIEIPVEGMTHNRVERFQDMLEELEVSGILHGNSGSSALINNGIYRVGDLIPGRRFVVAEIGKEFVLFRSLDHGGTVMKPIEPRGRKRRSGEQDPWEDEDDELLFDDEDG